MADDFNNHLTPILGFADLLLEGGRLPKDARLRRYVEAIRTAAEGASRVVSRLREFYRGHERGDGLTLIDPREVMREAMSLAEPRWRDQACSAAPRDARVPTEDRPGETLVERIRSNDGPRATTGFEGFDETTRGGLLRGRAPLRWGGAETPGPRLERVLPPRARRAARPP